MFVLCQLLRFFCVLGSTKPPEGGSYALISFKNLVAGAGNPRYLQLVDRKIPFVLPSLSIGTINGIYPTRCSLSA